MNKILLGILLLSSTLFSVEWSKDLNTAFALAQKEHKTVIGYFETEDFLSYLSEIETDN